MGKTADVGKEDDHIYIVRVKWWKLFHHLVFLTEGSVREEENMLKRVEIWHTGGK